MKKRKTPFTLIGVIVAVAIVSFFGFEAQGIKEVDKGKKEMRSDVLIIDSLAAFGKLEENKVEYHHDKHTDALEKMGKDCTSCHLKDPKKNNRLSYKFMRLEDGSKEQVKNIYHDNCIGCHAEVLEKGEKSGPTDVSCRGCHARKPKVVAAMYLPGMDKSLHYRHIKSQKKPDDDNCGVCHHEKDKASDKLVYVKGNEGTCRYCHKKEPIEKVSSLREASHYGCIACHQETALKKKESGPVKCAGCHDELKAKAIKKVKDVPRLKTRQLDYSIIKPEADDPALLRAGKDGLSLIDPVPFNHIAHEGYNDTCRVCHHAAMNNCTTCHTIEGAKEGSYIRLSQAMHLKTSEHSCMGCHEKTTERKECAGCHTYIVGNQNQDLSCKNCHEAVPAKYQGACCDQLPQLSGEAKKKAADCCETQQAKSLLDKRAGKKIPPVSKDIPEKVIIKVLADEYQPSEYPHKKILDTLIKGIKESDMAEYFHANEGVVCQSCHHHSPPSNKPPRCGSCHGKPFDATQPNRPGLKAAYHGQCIGCHTQMELEKPKATDCEGCHKKKK